MKKSIFILLLSLFCFYVNGQNSDTSKIDKRADYSNFNKSKQSVKLGTISAESAEINAAKDKSRIPVSMDYFDLTEKATTLFYKKHFADAIYLYCLAFNNNNDLGKVSHRYNTACCYAALNNVDSAFIQLYKIANKGKYTKYKEIESEKYFNNLKKDKRWDEIIALIKRNEKQLEDKLNSSLPKE